MAQEHNRQACLSYIKDCETRMRLAHTLEQSMIEFSHYLRESQIDESEYSKLLGKATIFQATEELRHRKLCESLRLLK